MQKKTWLVFLTLALSLAGMTTSMAKRSALVPPKYVDLTHNSSPSFSSAIKSKLTGAFSNATTTIGKAKETIGKGGSRVFEVLSGIKAKERTTFKKATWNLNLKAKFKKLCVVLHKC